MPKNRIRYRIANDLGIHTRQEGEREEAKELLVQAYKGTREMFGEEAEKR